MAFLDGLLRVIVLIEFKLVALEGRIERGKLRDGGHSEVEIVSVNLDPDGPVSDGSGSGNGRARSDWNGKVGGADGTVRVGVFGAFARGLRLIF